jgi:hypothetical protein
MIKLAPESTIAIATFHPFLMATASAAAIAFFAAAISIGAPYGVLGGATC